VLEKEAAPFVESGWLVIDQRKLSGCTPELPLPFKDRSPSPRFRSPDSAVKLRPLDLSSVYHDVRNTRAVPDCDAVDRSSARADGRRGELDLVCAPIARRYVESRAVPQDFVT